MIERWRWIPGYEERYEVSDLGRVRSWVNNRGYTRLIPKIRTQQVDKRGDYLTLNLCMDGTKKRRKVHQLVLEAFIGPRPTGTEGCHNDGDKSNNTLANLRWGTSSSNQQDAIRHGTWSNGNVAKQKCKRGHDFTAENTAIIINHGQVARRCKACRRRRIEPWN